MEKASFNMNDLILVGDNLPKQTLDEFEVGIHVILKSGGPDMWVLAIYGEKIECGFIENREADSEIFPYQCLSIKKEKYNGNQISQK